MNPERSSHPSAAQVETLIDLLERKPNLAKGFSKNQSAKQAANREWERIAFKLNSMGGSIKTAKKWTKYWSDKKSAVKKKAAARAASRNVTGGGMVEELIELSNLEERIVVLMGGEGFATGDRHLLIQPFDELSQEHSSPSILLPAQAQASRTCALIMPETEEILQAIPGTSAPVDQVINTTDVDLSLGHRGQSQLMDILLEPETVAGNTTPTRPNQYLAAENMSEINLHSTTAGTSTQQQQQYVPEPVIAEPPSSAVSTPRRRRRRISQPTRRNVQASPPSQRRTNLMGMAEKFLRLEQQRLDLNRRMIAVMERNSDRDHLVVEAAKAIAEGLKAVAEAIKR